MRRVVNLISGLMYGGGQKVAIDLCEGFSGSADIDAQLWLLGCRSETLRMRAAQIIDYDGRYSSPATLVAAARRLRAQLAASNVDIVHSHGWDADIIAYLATLGRPEARVVHLHVTPAWILSGTSQHHARRILTNLMFSGPRVRAIAVANAVRDHWAGVFPRIPSLTDVIYNSTDAIRFHPVVSDPVDGDTVVVGVACRLTPQKGLECLLRALPQVIDGSSASIRLRIAGEGPERELLQAHVKELGVTESVEFLGHVGDIEHFYRSIDVFVLPAVSDEGMPLAILEAMATALPVVASDVGGAREVIRDGVDGFVTAPNATDTLAQALIRLTADVDLRRRLGRNAAERVRTAFSPCSQLASVNQVYARLVAGTQASADARR